jgi:hypothetical protein
MVDNDDSINPIFGLLSCSFSSSVIFFYIQHAPQG